METFQDGFDHFRTSSFLRPFKRDLEALKIVTEYRGQGFSLSDAWRSIQNRFRSATEYDSYRAKLEHALFTGYRAPLSVDIDTAVYGRIYTDHPVKAFRRLRPMAYLAHLSDANLSDAMVYKDAFWHEIPAVSVARTVGNIGILFGYFCVECNQIHSRGRGMDLDLIIANQCICDSCLIGARHRKVLAGQRAAAIVRQFQAGKAIEAKRQADERERRSARISDERAAKKARRDEEIIRREAAALAWEMQGQDYQQQENSNA